MAGINPVKYVDYVCTPSSIKIEASHSTGSKYLYVCSKIGDKVGFEARYIFSITEEKEEFHKKVKIFCDAIFMFTEDEIQDYIGENKIMPALYAYRHLKEVRERGGGLIWRRAWINNVRIKYIL